MKKRMFVCFFIFTMSVFHLSIPSVVFGQSPAQRVFEKRKDSLFQRNDIRALFPDVLIIFTDPEHQIGLGPGVIEHFLNEPLFLKRYDSNINPQFLSLLTIDEELRMLFKDGDFHTVLQDPKKIEELVGLIPRPGKSEDGDCKPPPVPSSPRPPTLSIVSGNNQSGEIGKFLAQPFVVGVLDQVGKPLQGTAVTFAVPAGNGRLSKIMDTTDVYGQARTTLTLGSGAGRHSVTARATGISQTQTFTATAIDPPPPPEPVVPVRSSTEEPPLPATTSLPVVYWIEEGAIFRFDGRSKEALVEPLEGWTVTGLAMDIAENKLYWTEQQTDKQIGSIWSRDLNNKKARKLRSITAVPKGIVVDAKNDRLYWTNDRGKIQSINVNGSNFKGNFIERLGSPRHIALSLDGDEDTAFGTLYWTAYNAAAGSWSIWFKRLGSSVTKKEIMRDLGELGGIAVDGDQLYWTEKVSDNQGKISSVFLNGSGAKALFSLPGSVPLGLVADEAGRRLYWTDNSRNIQSLNLDEPVRVVVEGLLAKPAVAIALGRLPGGSVLTSSAPSMVAEHSVENTLLANYPNPFNPETWIPYQLSASADVSVSIYAVDGRLVRRLDLGHQGAGVYRSRSRAAYWDGRNEFGERVASGLYFYTLTAGDFTATRKMLIRK